MKHMQNMKLSNLVVDSFYFFFISSGFIFHRSQDENSLKTFFFRQHHFSSTIWSTFSFSKNVCLCVVFYPYDFKYPKTEYLTLHFLAVFSLLFTTPSQMIEVYHMKIFLFWSLKPSVLVFFSSPIL